MGNKSVSQSQSEDPRAQLGSWVGWLAPGALDKGEFAIYKQLGIPRGKIIQNAMTNLTQNEIQFMHAGRGRNIKAIRWYIQQGLSVNTIDENRTSILHIACRDGSIQIIEELLSKGANVNIADVGGWSALHISSHWGRSKIWELLLAKNADAFAKTNRHETPYDLAKNSDTRYIFDQYWKERENVEDMKIPSSRVHELPSSKVPKLEQSNFSISPNLSKIPQMNDPDIFPVNITPGRPRSPLATCYRPSSPFPEEDEAINPLMETQCLRVTETARIVDQSRGVSIFNISPLKGISYLILTGIVENDPNEVAELLHFVKELSPYGIGQILGWQEYGYDQVAKFYMERISLEKMDVIEALEQLLTNIALPQNDQMVEQVLSTFAEAY